MNKKGFTLIEIIIVIVILGVLATLALPRLTAQVAASEAAEAMQFLGVIKRAAYSCYDSAGNYENCQTNTQLGVIIPGGAKFSYFRDVVTSGDATATWWARATRATNTGIMMTVDSQGVTSFGANPEGPFLGIVNKTGSTVAWAAIPADAF
ncbi:MAG: prepilin-type N-terminal cleavage/methylation domain-containing protein [Candidatus Omnitrophica bacterium]|nr:prepilin-type N-terminal cleavage/methylation domain-containing protein [Candidatus Omnitrophota bacterium]